MPSTASPALPPRSASASPIAVFAPSRLGGGNLARPGSRIVALVGASVEHFVDQAEGLGFVGLKELVAVHRFLDLLDLLAGVLRVELVEALAHAQDLARLDLD